MLKTVLLTFLILFSVSNIAAQNTEDNVYKAESFVDSLTKKDFAVAYEYED